MKFRYIGTNIGPIPLTDLSSSIAAGPSGIQFSNIVSQNQTIEFDPGTIELQDSDEVVKSFESGQLRQLIDDGVIIADVAPVISIEYTPISPPDWNLIPPTTIYEGLDQAADIASSYKDGTATGIKLANGSDIGDATHTISSIFLDSIEVATSFNIKVGITPVATIDATTFSINEALSVIGGATVDLLTIGTLEGVLKATAGLVSGSSNTDDLPEGILNLYYTDARARASQSVTMPLVYNQITGNHTLAGLTGFGAANQIVSVNVSATGWEYKTLVGTTNQINVALGLGLITLSLPQDIATTSSPIFAGIKIGTLNGVLKATAGIVSGSVTADDIPAGINNRYYTDIAVINQINLQKGVSNGVASLDNTGKVPESQLPPGNGGTGGGAVYEVSNESEMLGLLAQPGDIVIRTDITRTFALAAAPASSSLNWKELVAAGGVFSINGYTETVVLTTDEIFEGVSNLYYTDERVDDEAARLFIAGAGDITWTYDDNLGTMSGVISLATKTTDDLVEGTDPDHLYFHDILVDHRVSNLLVAGPNIQLSYNENAGTLTIGASLTGSLLGEAIDEEVAALIKNGKGLDWTYDNNANSLTGDVTLLPFTTDDLAEGVDLAHKYFSVLLSDEAVFNLLEAGPNTTITYAGPGSTLIIDVDPMATNQLVADLITGSDSISWVYNGIDELVGSVSLNSFTTDQLNEGLLNFYFTDIRDTDHLQQVLIAGANIFINRLGPDAIEISTVFTGPNTFEEVDDRVAGLIKNGNGLTWTYSDITDELTGNVSLTPFITDNLSEGITNLYFTDERVDDRVAALLQPGNNITFVYDDIGGMFTINALFTGPNSFEDVDDRVAQLINSGRGIDWTYVDSSNTTLGTLTGVVTLAPFNTSELGEIPNYKDEHNNIHYCQYFGRTRVESAVFDMIAEPGAGTMWRVNGEGRIDEVEGSLGRIKVDLQVTDGRGIKWWTNPSEDPFDGNDTIPPMPPNYAQANITLADFTTDDLAEGVINKYVSQAGLAEVIDDEVATLLTAGPGIGLVYDDVLNKLQITAFLAAYDDERAMDAAAGMIQPAVNGSITWTYADALNKLTPTFHINTFTTDDLPQGITNLYMSLENVDDRVAQLIQPGNGLIWVYDDNANSLTGNVSLAPFTTTDLIEGTRQYYTDERVDDRVSLLIKDGTGITWFYDDAAGTLTPTISLAGFNTDALTQGTANKYYADELVDDRVSSLLQPGTGLTWAYDDTANTLTGNVSLTPFTTDNLTEGTTNKYFNDELVDDRVAALLVAGSNVTLVYDDILNTLTISSTGGGGGGSASTYQYASVISNTYTVLSTDTFIACNASAITTSTLTINLPTAVGVVGKFYIIKKVDSSIRTITIDPNGSQTIDGQATITLSDSMQSVQIVSDGANWLIA